MSLAPMSFRILCILLWIPVLASPDTRRTKKAVVGHAPIVADSDTVEVNCRGVCICLSLSVGCAPPAKSPAPTPASTPTPALAHSAEMSVACPSKDVCTYLSLRGVCVATDLSLADLPPPVPDSERYRNVYLRRPRLSGSGLVASLESTPVKRRRASSASETANTLPLPHSPDAAPPHNAISPKLLLSPYSHPKKRMKPIRSLPSKFPDIPVNSHECISRYSPAPQACPVPGPILLGSTEAIGPASTTSPGLSPPDIASEPQTSPVPGPILLGSTDATGPASTTFPGLTPP